MWEGMLTIGSDICQSVSTLMYLWKHECTRVIADRFISYEDREWFDKAMAKVVTESIGAEFHKHVEEEVFFVDFLRLASLTNCYTHSIISLIQTRLITRVCCLDLCKQPFVLALG